MDMHTCPCGKHENPGTVVHRVGKYIVVHVAASNGHFLEVRECGVDGDYCYEQLLFFVKEELCQNKS